MNDETSSTRSQEHTRRPAAATEPAEEGQSLRSGAAFWPWFEMAEGRAGATIRAMSAAIEGTLACQQAIMAHAGTQMQRTLDLLRAMQTPGDLGQAMQRQADYGQASLNDAVALTRELTDIAQDVSRGAWGAIREGASQAG